MVGEGEILFWSSPHPSSLFSLPRILPQLGKFAPHSANEVRRKGRVIPCSLSFITERSGGPPSNCRPRTRHEATLHTYTSFLAHLFDSPDYFISHSYTLAHIHLSQWYSFAPPPQSSLVLHLPFFLLLLPSPAAQPSLPSSGNPVLPGR